MLAHQAQHLFGPMSSIMAVVQHTRLKMRSLQAWYLSLFNAVLDPPSKLLEVMFELVSQLTWWGRSSNLLVGRSFGPLDSSVQLTTDSSPTGWGAHSGSLTVYGLWSAAEARLHISHLELLAIIKALQTFEWLVVGRMVQVATDSTDAHLLCQ